MLGKQTAEGHQRSQLPQASTRKTSVDDVPTGRSRPSPVPRLSARSVWSSRQTGHYICEHLEAHLFDGGGRPPPERLSAHVVDWGGLSFALLPGLRRGQAAAVRGRDAEPAFLTCVSRNAWYLRWQVPMPELSFVGEYASDASARRSERRSRWPTFQVHERHQTVPNLS